MSTRFTVQNGLVFVSDDRAGSHASLFVRGGSLAFHPGASSFDDARRAYTWAFALSQPLSNDDVLIFATDDREVAAVYNTDDGALRVDPHAVIAVRRGGDGAPLSGALLRTARAALGASASANREGPPITILVVTMDRRDILEHTLWHIYETSTDAERDLWIWDNASSDDTSDFLGTLQGWPGVRCFRSEDDLGVAGPRRKMIPHVRTPYVFTLDDDMWMLNAGWASGVSRVLEHDPTVCQAALGSMPHLYGDYGIAHTKLDRPFFRMPPYWPGPKGDITNASARTAPPGARVIDVAGEAYTVPESGTQLPFSCTGGAAGWRTADIMPLLGRPDRHAICDLRETWGFPLQRERGMREATMVGYGVHHPSPGPLWHLGRGEPYWAERCRFAEAIYGRSAETQRAWLEATRAACGWGRPLEDPDTALPATPPSE